MAAVSVLNEIVDKINGLSQEEKEELALFATSRAPVWAPNPGPQTEALECEADELFYGGQAGGGKTDLVLGAALTRHSRSLIMRRFNKDAKEMADRLLDDILQSRDGWSGQDAIWRGKHKTIMFSGCQEEKDKQRWKGKPHDLKAFDEITDFLESQYRFIIGWNRTTKPGQRCRVICTGNPPTESSGLWVIQYWGPWLDPTHPNPAEEGELRWYTTIEGKDIEVDGPGPHKVPGEPRPVYAKSRTFIRARLEDNPDLMADGQYESRLSAMPKELRDAYRDGRFDASMKDNPWQVIPTMWVIAAQRRWNSMPPAGVPMCAMGVDVAQGGADQNVIATRYDGWYAPFFVQPGAMTPLGGPTVAGMVISKRKDRCPVVVDCGGGYGGEVFKHLKDNDVTVFAHRGAEKSERRTSDQKLKFRNKRSEIIWRFREALDPEQNGGSTIALPPDSECLSDLTAPTFEVRGVEICVESKEDIVKRLGRSPDKGDAVCMAWSVGDKIASAYGLWQAGASGKRNVVRSHAAARRKR